MYLLPTSIVHVSYHVHLLNHSLALGDETGKTSSDTFLWSQLKRVSYDATQKHMMPISKQSTVPPLHVLFCWVTKLKWMETTEAP